MNNTDQPPDKSHTNSKGTGKSTFTWLWLIPLTAMVALVLFVFLPWIFPSSDNITPKPLSAAPQVTNSSTQPVISLPIPPLPKLPAYDFPAEGAKEIIVLMYHNFNDNPGNRFEISPQTFSEQLDLLASEGCRVVPLSVVIQAMEKHDFSTLPARPVVITVDDGYENFYTKAYPIVRERTIPVTLSIYTAFTNSGRSALSWEQLKELVASGWVEIASHSVQHSNLTKERKGETPEQFAARRDEEITMSKKILEEKLGMQVWAFAYPGGNRNAEIDELVEKAGYRGALTIYDGPNLPDESPFKIRRYGIYRNTTLEMLNNYLSGARVTDENFHVGKPLKKEQKKQIKSHKKPATSPKTTEKTEPARDKILKRPGNYH